MAQSHYEVLGPAPGEPSRPGSPGWLARNRLILLVVAILAVIVGREVLTGDSGPPATPGSALSATIRGIGWEPVEEFGRKIEVELMVTGVRPVAAARLQMSGNGVAPGGVIQLNQELAPGRSVTAEFGVGDPYCVPGGPEARLDGVIFDRAGTGTPATLTVADPDGILTRINDLACFGNPQEFVVTPDPDAASIEPAQPDPDTPATLQLPLTIENRGSLPIVLASVLINDRAAGELVHAVPGSGRVEVDAVISTCMPSSIASLAVHGEDFGGAFIQASIELDDRLRSVLESYGRRNPCGGATGPAS